MKKVLLLRTGGMSQELLRLRDGIHQQLQEGDQITVANFDEFAYYVNGNDSTVSHIDEGWDMADFDLVIFSLMGKQLELGIAAAHYLYARNVPFHDHYLLTQGKGKLAGSFLRTAHNLPVPRTYYAPTKKLANIFRAAPPLSFPFILKADDGKKGKDNYLVRTIEELERITSTSDLMFVAQPYIENDGDYRILVLDNLPAVAIYRKGKEGSHLNNTSQGGSAQLVEVNELPHEIVENAIKGARLEDLAVAGVDVIVDKKTKQHYILEVNRAPQITTGAFPDQKMKMYGIMIKNMLAGTAHKQ